MPRKFFGPVHNYMRLWIGAHLSNFLVKSIIPVTGSIVHWRQKLKKISLLSKFKLILAEKECFYMQEIFYEAAPDHVDGSPPDPIT